MTVPHNASAKHGAQFTRYAATDVDRVAAVLDRHQGPQNAATEQRMALEAGMPERRFRSVLTEHDGTRWLLGKVNHSKAGEGGLFVAVAPEDAASLTAELRSKQDTLAHRLGRRQAMAEAMVEPSQLNLFERVA